MLPTSGTFEFQSTSIELLIREAFERIGISGEFIEPVKLDSAKRSIDLMLLEWMNKSVNLWTLEDAFIPLSPYLRQYPLPSYISDIIQANLRTTTRQNSGGTAFSDNGGVAANAFDGDPKTACTQTAPNGYISYTYPVGQIQQISFVGITSNVTRQYGLVVETSNDGVTWALAWDLGIINFTQGVNQWFDVPEPSTANAFRIRETGGAILDIQEIYFNNNIQDVPISNVSRNDYFTYTNKYQIGRPSVYYLERHITPLLKIWPVASADYNCLQISYKKMIEDTGSLYTNTVQIPSRFYPALVWGLAYQLAVKFNPQQAPLLKNEYEQSFAMAATEDSESTPFTIHGDFSSYYE